MQAAAIELKAAIAADSANESYRYDYILALLRTGYEAEAGRELDDAIALFPKSAKLHSILGMRAYANGQNEEAVRFYEMAVSLEPNAADLHAALGNIHSAMADYDKAAIAFAMATRFDPADADFHLQEGINFVHLQNATSASRSFRKVLTLDRKNAQAHLQLGKLAAAEARLTAARFHLEIAVASGNVPVEAFYQLSQVYRRLGRHSDATKALQTFRERKAGDDNKEGLTR